MVRCRYYCTYVFICEGRDSLPDVGGILWFGNGKTSETCFTPFYAGINAIADPYKTGDARMYTRDSAFWAFNFVENWATLNYRDIHADIVAKRETLEKEAAAAVADADKHAAELLKQDPDKAREWLTEFCMNTANNVFLTWQEFGDLLIARYADGGLNYPGELYIKKGYRGMAHETSWPRSVNYEKQD